MFLPVPPARIEGKFSLWLEISFHKNTYTPLEPFLPIFMMVLSDTLRHSFEHKSKLYSPILQPIPEDLPDRDIVIPGEVSITSDLRRGDRYYSGFFIAACQITSKQIDFMLVIMVPILGAETRQKVLLQLYVSLSGLTLSLVALTVACLCTYWSKNSSE